MQQEQGIPVYNIYDWWYEPFWYRPYFRILFWIIGILFLCTLLFFIVRYIKKMQKKPLDPWQEALNQLQRIRLELFEDEETHKMFYTHLTHVLKNYLAQRYGLSLEGKTDQEVIQEVKHSPLPIDLQEQVRSLFSGAEIIKFAHQEGAGERMRYDLIRAIDIVRNTIPQQTKDRTRLNGGKMSNEKN
jgi:hypothetical protein